MVRYLVASLLVVAMVPAPADAQAPRRLGDTRTGPGTLIFIEGRDRRQIVARFVRVNGNALLAQVGGVDRTFQAGHIRQITGERRDFVKNGAIIGGAVGFGLGLASCGGGGVDSGGCGNVGGALAAGALTAGIGAWIDFRRGKEVFYRSP